MAALAFGIRDVSVLNTGESNTDDLRGLEASEIDLVNGQFVLAAWWAPYIAAGVIVVAGGVGTYVTYKWTYDPTLAPTPVPTPVPTNTNPPLRGGLIISGAHPPNYYGY